MINYPPMLTGVIAGLKNPAIKNPNYELLKSLDIVAEHELILQKKSKLSANQRETVEYLYNMKMEKERESKEN